MAIQINTDSLTKPHHFIFEACKILWRNKKVFFAFALLPMVLDVMGFASIKFTEMQYILSIEQKRKTEFSKDLVFYRQQGIDESYRLEPSPEQRRKYIKSEYWRGERPATSVLIRIAQVFIFLKSISAVFFGIAWFQYLLNPLYKASFRNYFTLDERFFKFLGILICGFAYMVLGFAFAWILQIPQSIELWKIFADPARMVLKIAFNVAGSLATPHISYAFGVPIEQILIDYLLCIGGIIITYVQLPKLPSIALNRTISLPQNKKMRASPRGKLFWGVLLLSLIAAFLSIAGTGFLNSENVGLSTWSNIQYGLSVMGISVMSSILFFMMVGIILNIITLYHKEYIADAK
jgi:hypothetical protein